MTAPNPKLMFDQIEKYCQDERLDPTRMGDTDIVVHAGVYKPATRQVVMHRFTLPTPNVLKLASIANLPVPPARLASVNVSLRHPHPLDPGALSLSPTHLPKYLRLLPIEPGGLTEAAIDDLYVGALNALDSLMTLIDRDVAAAADLP